MMILLELKGFQENITIRDADTAINFNLVSFSFKGIKNLNKFSNFRISIERFYKRLKFRVSFLIKQFWH